MGLAECGKKRNIEATPESTPRVEKRWTGIFVVQMHRAGHLHYDFRLELGGVLKSWAVPKGPSIDPRERRLAMEVEDHPLAHADFEGVIPEGLHGGGTVMVWDSGTWEPEGDVEKAFRTGKVSFVLRGRKLGGAWVLVRTHDRSWLLTKRRDRWAASSDIAEAQPRSVISRRTLAQIASDGGEDVARAATGDPAQRRRKRSRPKRKGARPAAASRGAA